MNRREFLGTVGAAALAPALAAGQERRKPNIIWLMADDLGVYDVGCYGQKHIQTPHIDRLAAEGVRFTQCYAGSTVCAPSRSALMTGLHTGHTTVRGNSSAIGKGRVPLNAADVTVAEALKAAGYATAIVGKWGLGEPGTPGIPNQQGFDFWFGYLNQAHAHEYYPDYLWRNTDKVPLNQGGQKTDYSHDLMATEALDFVRRSKDKPFFLYFTTTIPHAKFQVPSLEPYEDKPWPAQAKAYAAMVTRMDRDFGRLMALLKELDLDRDTIVFFTSDNGGYPDGEARKMFDPMGPLRGQKGNLYEGGLRVPMIVRWLGKIAPGRTSDQAWAFWDFFPTACELAGVEPPQGLDGISMLPAILGKEQKGHEFLYWEFRTGGFSQAVRSGDWKGVRHGTRGSLELYDLKTDLGETKDVAAEHPDVVAKVEAFMAGARTESEHWPALERRPGKKK